MTFASAGFGAKAGERTENRRFARALPPDESYLQDSSN
jgi:hypothetical protein